MGGGSATGADGDDVWRRDLWLWRRRRLDRQAALERVAELDRAKPARDKRVRLPHEESSELEPPSSEHVEPVVGLLPSAYRLPLLWLDWSGARVASVETVTIGDYDEPATRVRLRASTTT